MSFFCLPLGNLINLAFKCFNKSKFKKQFYERNVAVLNEELVSAVLAKKWKKCEELIGRGADINHTVNKFGEPILFFAKDVVTIRKLLELGADINARDYSGEGILGHAILNSWGLDTIQELIKQGANIGCRNNLYISPLERAVAVGNHEKIKLLIEKGACCNDERSSETPMNYCINNFEGAKTVIKHVMLKYFDRDYTTMIGLENYNYPYIFKNYEYLKQYFVQCETELQRMKCIKISKNLTLLELIQTGDSLVDISKEYLTDAELLLASMGDNVKKSKRNRVFPIYQDLIKPVLLTAIQRKHLLQKLEHLSLNTSNGESLDTPSKIIIFKYLPNEALIALIKSYKKRTTFKSHVSKVKSLLNLNKKEL